MRSWLRPRIALTTLLFSPLALSDCPELLQNGDFETGDLSSWNLYGTHFYATGVIDDPFNAGNMLLEFDYSELEEEHELWDGGLQQEVEVVEGATYRLTFWARGDDQYSSEIPNELSPGFVSLAADDAEFTNYGLAEAFDWVWGDGGGMGYSFEFTATETGPALLTLFFGEEDVILSIDSISLQEISSSSCTGSGGDSGTGGTSSGGASSGGASSGGASSGGATTGGASSGGASTGGASSGGSPGNTGGIGGQIHNNQLGYVPSSEKIATLVHASTSPVTWQLRDSSGAVADSGETRVSGTDAASGDHTHVIDFSSYEEEGSGYRLWVGTAAGPEFGIGGDAYAELRRDALRFFYYQRSSQAISSTYSEGAAYARAAGHTDTSVGCASPTDCTYSLDIASGWYDAGDYGKYVVNGGISLWTLLNLYERTQHLGTDLDALGDGKNNIPESTNGASDLLDEAKREILFFLGMQVPQGQPLAGMAHHKAHSTSWDGIPVLPSDALPHYLRPPSTAATLNLAATAAQCARIYASIDAPLAADCLAAAELAYDAAIANPARLAPTDDDAGGGNYSDGDVSDEFYWAAAELFITTGTGDYLDALLASDHHENPPLGGAALGWPTTATLGMISLATVPSELDDEVVDDVRAALILRAEEDFALAAEGYGTSIDEFYWGSNSSVLNASLLHAVAYDLTGEAEHRAAALAGLDYVLGRNPLGQSYVSGYGVMPFQNAHHRTWAVGYSSAWPSPPPGVLAGGPNQTLDGLSAPTISSLGLTGCDPSKCWADYAPGYSLTEVTINWNAPLAWLASWASELENDPKQTFPDDPGNGGSGGSSSGDGGTSNADGGTNGSGDGGTGSQGDGGSEGNSETGGTDGGGDCTDGDEGCACFPNDTCNDDLSCLSGLCVDAGEGSDGGSDGSDGSDGSSGSEGGCSHTPVPRSPAGPLGSLGLLGLGWFLRRRAAFGAR